MLAWNPQVGDLAAQVFRTELFQHAGLAIWNGSWYGGHYTLTYSFLFPPLAALLGAAGWWGRSRSIASSYLFDRLVRDRWGEAARWATLWFAAGVVTLLADGQLTFALGVAFGLASLRCLQVGRGKLAASPRPPPARSRQPGRRRLPRRRGRWSAPLRAGAAPQPGRDRRRCAALGLIVLPNLAFPESGQFPFAFSSFIAIPLWCGGALFVTRGLRGEERQLRWVARSATCSPPTLLSGWRPTRWAATRCASARSSAARSSPPSCSRGARGSRLVHPRPLAAMAGGLYWQVTASVSQIARSVGDPSTSRSYFQPAARWLRDARRQRASGSRCRRPPTTGSPPTWRPQFELARGWLRQLDTTRDDIFYDDDSRLTAATTAPGCATTRSATSPSPTRRSTTPRSPSAG